METTAKVTAKGQVTIPRSVRDELGLQEGGSVVFRVEGNRAVMSATGDLLDLAGSVSVPAAKRGTPSGELRRATRRRRSAARA